MRSTAYVRYGTSSLRSKHGASLDVELLAAAYVELPTTCQAALQFDLIARATVIQLPIAKRRVNHCRRA